MKHLSREKAALIFFIFLICFGLGISLFYISKVSQPLNVAASNIDDAAGSLDGYTAIVYEGLAEKEQDSLSEESDDTSASEELNRKSQESSKSESGEATASSALSEQDENGDSKKIVTVDGIKRTYVEKGAAVFELEVADSSEYEMRSIVRAGKYSFGMISVPKDQNLTGATLEEYLQMRVKEYKEANVDFVILIVDNLSMLLTDKEIEDNSTAGNSELEKEEVSSDDISDNYADKQIISDSDEKKSKESSTDKTEISLKGIQIVISKKNEGLHSGGVTVDGIYYNDASLKGEVGTLLVSPSKVISAKDIS